MTLPVIHEWLRLDIRAPLASFGAPAIDSVRNTSRLPGQSMITGLVGAALGVDRTDTDRLEAIQDALVFAAVEDMTQRPHLIVDAQNARLYEMEAGWTTSGVPELRNKGASYAPSADQHDFGRRALTARKKVEYLADGAWTVVLRLDVGPGIPGIDELQQAFIEPRFPLSIGRRCNIPSRPLLSGRSRGATGLEALKACGVSGWASWPCEAGNTPGVVASRAQDLRSWRDGFHAGGRMIESGPITV